MALKIASIDGKQNIVVTSAEYVQATGIVGLETSGNIEKIIQGDKVILSGKGVDLSNYYQKNETSGASEISAALDLKENKVFVAEYNVTTYADVKAAYDAGKQIVCKYNPLPQFPDQTIYAYLTQYVPMGNTFCFAANNTSNKFKMIECQSNGWVVSNHAYQEELTFEYDSSDAITSINSSAIGGSGGQEYSGAGIIVVDGDTISADMSDYYNVEEVNELLDEKEDKIKYSYDKNRAISAINGSAVAQTESWRLYSEQAGSMSDSYSNVYIGNGNRDRTSTNTFNIGSNNRASACTGSFNIGSENIIDTGFVVTNIGNQNTKVSSYDTSELSSFIPYNDFAKKYNGGITADIGTPGGTNIGYNNRMVYNGINIGNTNIILRSSNMGDAINIGKYNINNYGVIIGQRNETTGYSFIIGEDSFADYGSFAYGKAVSAIEGSYAFGDSVNSRQGAIAIGRKQINALGESLALGFRGVTANGEAVAIGSEGVTAQGGGIAIGRQGIFARDSNGNSNGHGSLAIGSNGITAGNGATAIGSLGVTAENTHALAIGGDGLFAQNGMSIAMGGYGNTAKNDSIHIGVKGIADVRSIIINTNDSHGTGNAYANNYSLIGIAADNEMNATANTGSVILGAGRKSNLQAYVGSMILNASVYDNAPCNLQSMQNSIIMATPSNNIDYDVIHRNGTASYNSCNLLVKNNSLMLGAGINGSVTVENDSYLIGGNTKGNTSGYVKNGSWVMGYNNMADGGNFILGHRNDAAGVIAEKGTSAEVRPYNQAIILGNNNFVRNYKPYLYALKPIYKERKLFSAYISDDVYKATWYGDSYLGSDESIIKNLIVGDYNRVSGYNAFVFGMANTAGVESYNYNPETSSISGDKNDDGFTLAFGMHNRAVRNYDIAIGLGTTASGGENIAIGTIGKNGSSISQDKATVAIGYKNIAHHSHIEGIENIALNSNVQIPFTAGGSTDSYAYTHNFFRNVAYISLNNSNKKFSFNDNTITNIGSLLLNYSGNGSPWSQNTISNVTALAIGAQDFVNNKIDTVTGLSFGAQTATRNILQYIKDSSFGAKQFDANILYDVGGDSQAVNFSANYMYKNIIAHAGRSTYNPLAFTANVVANNIINNTKITGSTTLGLFDNIFCHSQITLNDITSGIDITDNNLFTDAVLYGTYVDGGAVNETFSFASPEGYNNEQARLKHVTKTVNFGDNQISNASETHVMGSMNKVFDAGKTRIFGTCNEVLGNSNDYFNAYGGLTVENTIIGTVNSIANIHSAGNYNTCFNNNLILGKANTLYFRGLTSTWLTNNTIIGGNNGFYDIPSANIQNIISRSLYGFINYNNGYFHENILGLGTNYNVGKAHNLFTLYGSSASYNNARNTILGYHSVIGSNIDDTTLIGSYNNAYYDKKAAYDEMLARYPEYDSATSYNWDDYVQYNGIVYKSISYSNKGYSPSENPTKWKSIPYDPISGSYGVNSNNFALGAFNLLINGSNQIALGNSNITSGHDAMVLGEGLIANASQVVVGRFNETVNGTNGISAAGIDNTSGAVFVVGNGIHQNSNYDATATKRSNAMIVSADGTVSATRFATSGIADLEAKILELENIITTFSARWVLTNQPEQNNG